ncbi:MAG: M14 family metallopeptidase, partial [bacterium]
MKSAFLLLLFLLSCLGMFSQENWATYYEQSGFRKTPRYGETMEYCQRLANASPRVHLASFGKSPQGRDLPLLIVDRDGLQDPQAIRSKGRLILLIQACIHPGESEGKDAGLMLVRDLVMGGPEGQEGTKDEGRGAKDEKRGTRDEGNKNIADLLDHVSILFIPIFNVDGHERFGPYNRINQNGPDEMGWRVTATNLNLNRDFLKADTPEMQAWLHLFNQWNPDFFIDIHTTDGADYQYVLTYMMEVYGQMDKGLTFWCADAFLPAWTAKLDSAGFPVFPYVSFRKWHDPRSGLISDVAPPMLSQGYVALRNRPGLLIETHMLKSYQQRVESVYASLVASLEILDQQTGKLKQLITEADRYVTTPEFLKTEFPLQFETSLRDSVMVDFLGVEYEEVQSELSGGIWFRYSSTPATFQIPWFTRNLPSETVRLPKAYIIPVEWKTVIDRLELHGIRMKKLEKDSVLTVTSYKFKDPRWQSNSYEGRHPMTHIEFDTFKEQ